MADKAIILFDGICNLCNNVVQFVIKRDPECYFSFASLQSDFSRDLLSKMDAPQGDVSSILLIEKGKVYHKSTAALRISRHLNRGWKAAVILYLIPPFIRDAIYSFIARHRYRWFGKRNECMTPNPSIKKRFLG